MGLGNIGSEIAKMGKAFDMRILAIWDERDPRTKLSSKEEVMKKLGLEFLGRREDLGYLLKNSAFLSISVPLTPETRGMIGEKELSSMKPTAFIINTARGAIIREEALSKALKEGWIAGAGIDTWYSYPTDPKAPSGLQYQ
jgi:lactate dehydrogenase-like 2-hydroxyacid dehydrogenase